MVAYVVFINEGTCDPEEMQRYRSLVPATTKGVPLTILAQNGTLETVEGDPPEGLTLVSFPTMAEASAWYHSPAYQEVARHRMAGGTFRVLITQGLA